MSVTVRQRDRGMSRLIKVLDELETRPPKVTVGVHWEEGVQDHRGPTHGVDVMDVARILEFGSELRAPVAFLRLTIDARRGELERLLRSAAERAVKSAIYGTAAEGHAVRAFGRVAARSRRIVQRRLQSLGLRDTGHLIESILGKVNGRLPEEE